MFQVKNLTLSYGSKLILDDVNFEVNQNDWYMVVGPNGAGKTSIVRAISGAVPYSGMIEYQGKDIQALSSKEKAKRIGVLTQHHNPIYHYSVEEIVELGRYAHKKGLFGHMTQEDIEKVDEAIQITGLEKHRYSSILSLSGGELQRVFLAQIIAQDPNIIILDEPANHLDLAYQEQIFKTIQEWVKEPGRCVISIIHDLSVAKFFGNRGLLLNNTRVISEGEIDCVLNTKSLEKAYGVDVEKLMHNRYALWV